MINKVTLIGNLGRDPEMRRLENGVAVARLVVATNESYRDKSDEWQTITEWHNVICWRYLAERAEQMLKKGSMVYIEGKLTSRKWQDQNGNDRYTTEVVANTFRLLERRERNDAGRFPTEEPPRGSNTPPPSNAMKNEAAPIATEQDDDLPF